MHLSLKGSLIRSPMLNRVGQRLLQLFEGASAAYSLRNLASNIASVVRVRRASDNSEKDFSAADVSSGAMTQWVGTTEWADDASSDSTSNWRTVDSTISHSVDKYVLTYTANTQWAILNTGPNLINNNPITISVDVKNGTSGNAAVYLGASNIGAGNQTLGQIGTTSDSWQTLTATFNATSSTFNEPSIRFDMTSGTVEFKNFTVSQGNNGFVETWYDQSGNGNDAVQLTASSQPKIVSNGSIITDSNGNKSIEFLRSLSLGNGILQLETGIAPMGTTNFAVVEYKRNFSYHLTGFQGGSVRIGRYNNDKFRILNGGITVDSTNTTFTANAVHLATVDIATSGGTTKAFLDGVEVISNNFADATDDFEQIFRGDNNSDNPVNMTELVIFGTNQSANRVAIEDNINNQYDIY